MSEGFFQLGIDDSLTAKKIFCGGQEIFSARLSFQKFTERSEFFQAQSFGAAANVDGRGRKFFLAEESQRVEQSFSALSKSSSHDLEKKFFVDIERRLAHVADDNRA